ncbi:hypothetical protein, partial [Enterobacter hormaechei]|uniref:hypothetical protein n=1 Tax=Enterobacter hormaechei TaxID=158836 RepID=UPI003F5256CC
MIRNYLFSDLTGKSEKKGYAKHIHMPDICIGMAYAYTHHLHMLYIYICRTSAYTEHMHTPGAMNLIPDMHHISILTREKNHENRIYFQK